MHLQSPKFHFAIIYSLKLFIFLGIFLLLSYENYNASKRGFTAKAFCCGNDKIPQLLEKPDGKKPRHPSRITDLGPKKSLTPVNHTAIDCFKWILIWWRFFLWKLYHSLLYKKKLPSNGENIWPSVHHYKEEHSSKIQSWKDGVVLKQQKVKDWNKYITIHCCLVLCQLFSSIGWVKRNK